jgi:hypothetical protein
MSRGLAADCAGVSEELEVDSRACRLVEESGRNSSIDVVFQKCKSLGKKPRAGVDGCCNCRRKTGCRDFFGESGGDARLDSPRVARKWGRTGTDVVLG